MSTTAPEYLTSLRDGFADAVQQWVDQSTTAWDQWSQAWAPVAEAAGLGMPGAPGAAPGRRSKGGHQHGHDHQHGHTTSHGEKGCGCGDPVAVVSTAVSTVDPPGSRLRLRRARPPTSHDHGEHDRPRHGHHEHAPPPGLRMPRRVWLRRRLRLLRARGGRDRARPRRRGAGGALPAAQPVAPGARGHPRGRAVARLRRRRPRDPRGPGGAEGRPRSRARTGWSGC